jgi:hypothetical protein
MEPKDYEDMYAILSQRINGGRYSNSILDRLKEEFMNYKLLTIENIESIAGTNIHYKGIEWNIRSVERTSTTYEFLLIGEWPVRMVLNRVEEGRVYTLHNDDSGAYQRVGRELLKDKNEFLKVLVGLTDELPF